MSAPPPPPTGPVSAWPPPPSLYKLYAPPPAGAEAAAPPPPPPPAPPADAYTAFGIRHEVHPPPPLLHAQLLYDPAGHPGVELRRLNAALSVAHAELVGCVARAPPPLPPRSLPLQRAG